MGPSMYAGGNSVRSDIFIENPPTILRSPEGAASPCAASATISTVEETSAAPTGLMARQQAGFYKYVTPTELFSVGRFASL